MTAEGPSSIPISRKKKKATRVQDSRRPLKCRRPVEYVQGARMSFWVLEVPVHEVIRC